MSATINGVGLTWARVTIPWSGVPILECDAPEEVQAPGGAITALVEDLTFVGTIPPKRSGVFVGGWRAFAVAGRNGWGNFLPAVGYNSPLGLLNSQIILDAARVAGELPPIVAAPYIFGTTYVRRGDLPASQVFSKLQPGSDWWIDPSTGIAQVGMRGAVAPDTAAFDLIDFNTREGRLLLATDTPSAFKPGASFIDPAVGAFVVNAAIITSQESGVRVEVWLA